MIKNERQYLITRKRIAKFEQSLAKVDSWATQAGLSPVLVRAQRDGVESQLRDLREEATDYENLRSGKIAVAHVDGILDIPSVLIRARIARGWTQKQLGEAVGLKEQQIQRCKSENYQTATLARLNEVATVLNVRLREDVQLRTPPEVVGHS